MFKTFQYRIKDGGLQNKLHEKAISVNVVWNFCNETQKHALKWHKKWPNYFDLAPLTAGSSKELRIHSTTIQSVVREYSTRRSQFKKPSLNWRSSKRSLDWIPFSASGIKFNSETGSAVYSGLAFEVWYSRPVQGQIKCGNISQDARGRYYLNLVCEIPDLHLAVRPADVGIDLGLKDLATLSTGQTYGAQRYFRRMERKLARSQQARKKKQTRNIHAKIKNSRKDFNHKVSTEIASNFSRIFIGDVKAGDIIKKPNMAKSVHDAGWYQFTTFLSYKALARGGRVFHVNERYSTQRCSACGVVDRNSPKGTGGLKIREWRCSRCLTLHHRDVNAARNILAFGHESLLT